MPCLAAEIVAGVDSIAVKNQGSQSWKSVLISLNETDESAGFEASIRAVEPHSAETISLSAFVRADGLLFDPKRYKILDISLFSEQGLYSQSRRCEPSMKQRNEYLMLKLLEHPSK